MNLRCKSIRLLNDTLTIEEIFSLAGHDILPHQISKFSNELASTTEEQDDDFSKLEYDLTNEIERMTGTAPPYEIVKLLFKNI